jgi:hypothetical protein
VSIFWLDQYSRQHLLNDVESLKDIIDELVPALMHLYQQHLQLQKKHEELKA